MVVRMLLAVLVLASCSEEHVSFSALEWGQLENLSGLPDPPADPSNRYAASDAAAALGHRLYFDAAFSGDATLVTTTGAAMTVAQGRAPKGEPVGVACATCHDLGGGGGGSDHSSQPGRVSIGAGAYDVNGLSTLNAAYARLLYWNGRNDSLWSQIVAVGESPVSMAGNRLRTAWRLADGYRAEYEAIFGDLPMAGTVAAAKARLEPDGQCALEGGACPADCRADAATADGCYPRFPLEGRPGATAGCQRGAASEPFGDAFDCMDPVDQEAVTRVYVNFAKAIAAYETRLVSRDSAFDRFVAEGPGSATISASAQRGAKLFVGRALCVECHDTALLSDNDFHDIGVGQDGDFVPRTADCPAGNPRCDCTAGTSCLPWGFRDGLAKLQANKFRRDSKWSDDPTDASRASYYTAPLSGGLKGAWRTPSLRNVALTAPYMHDGVYATLAEVVGHYARAGAGSSGEIIGEPDPRIGDLGLSDEDQADLVELLATFTGAPLAAELTGAPELPPPTVF